MKREKLVRVKPEPLPIAVALSWMGVAYAASCLLVGDSPRALEACLAVLVYIHVREWIFPEKRKPREPKE